MTRSRIAAMLLLAATLAGCDDAPEKPTDSESSAAEDPCHRVSDADLTDWVGSPQTVLDAAGNTEGSTDVTCRSLIDDESAPEVTWTLHEPRTDASFAENADTYATFPSTKPIRLAGGTPALKGNGTLAGERRVQILVQADDGRILEVEATTPSLSDRDIPSAVLGRLATHVALVYAA